MTILATHFKPNDEIGRQSALDRLHVLDTPKEKEFDKITDLVTTVLKVPVAAVTLIDRDRQWFKSRLGWNRNQCSRDISFCGHAILADSLMVVPDALDDPRFAANPLVTGDPQVRFYAGAVVRGPSGHALGTLCVLDYYPRYFDDEHRSLLRRFADLIENEIAHQADLLALNKQPPRRL
jgi:GAF domain-containing protein